MRILSFFLLGSLMLGHAASHAAEVRILCSVGLRPPIEKLAREFEAREGRNIAVEFGTAAQLKARIDAGQPFDVAIIGAAQIDDLIKSGKAVAASRVEIARAGLGFAVPAQSATPEVGSDDALKAYLRGVRRIASGNPANGGFGAVYFDRMLVRLGIAAEVQPKIVFAAPGDFARKVIEGQADVGVGLMGEIVNEPSVRAVALRPEDPDSYLVFAGAVSANARGAEGESFLRHLSSAEARAALVSAGMTVR